MDLYWQFAAWAKQPLVISNWGAILFYGFALGLMYNLWQEIREVRNTLNNLTDALRERDKQQQIARSSTTIT
jgi:hypothetical protein